MLDQGEPAGDDSGLEARVFSIDVGRSDERPGRSSVASTYDRRQLTTERVKPLSDQYPAFSETIGWRNTHSGSY